MEESGESVSAISASRITLLACCAGGAVLAPSEPLSSVGWRGGRMGNMESKVRSAAEVRTLYCDATFFLDDPTSTNTSDEPKKK